MLLAQTTGKIGNRLDLSQVEAVLTPERWGQLQQLTAHIAVQDRVVQYALDIVRGSRQFVGIEMGAGSRAGMALIRASKAKALMAGREFVVPDDVASVALPVLRHRIRLSADFMIDGYKNEQVIANLLASVNAPRS